MAERGGGANPHAFGTFGISPAEQARIPKASGDTSPRTFGRNMTLWIGAEIDTDVADLFRPARATVETSINEIIAGKDYKLPVDVWDCIAIVRSDALFPEKATYSKRKRDMDFRLHIDHAQFASGAPESREALIYQMLLRSLHILEDKSGSFSGFTELISDIETVAAKKNWKNR